MITRNNNNFKNESFNNQMQQTEKVHYLGDLRIIGQVVNKLEDKEPIGYVIMTEKTQRFKMYTVSQTIALLQKFKFVNAALENGKIVNTECSMTKMPKFNTNMMVIGNTGILILGEIRDGSIKAGYRAMDTNAKIIDISEAELLKLSKTGINILNAKIVTRDNKESISGIKQEFTKIEKSKLVQLNDKKDTKEKMWIKKRHSDNWFNHILPNVLIHAFTNEYKLINKSGYAREEHNGFQNQYLDINRETKIILKEIYTDKYGIKLTNQDKELLKKITKLKHKDCLGKHSVLSPIEDNYIDDDTALYLVALAQFVLNNEEQKRYIVGRIIKSKKGLNERIIDKMVVSHLISDSLNKTLTEVRQALKFKKECEKNKNSINTPTTTDKEKMFTTSTFTTAEDMAQLGFTISEANRDYEYRTKTGNRKTLLYLGDVISTDYEKYKGMSRCLGDIVTIAYIEKLLSRYGELNTDAGYATHYNMKKKDIKAVIQIIISISFMFNSLPMKNYVEHKINDKLEQMGIHLDYEEIANVDYKLPKEVTMYYSSGFNVFLNDNEYIQHNYTRGHLKYAKLINYRQLGIKHNIQHPILQGDLASVVNMVTDNSCDAETIERLIGQLRYL